MELWILFFQYRCFPDVQGQDCGTIVHDKCQSRLAQWVPLIPLRKQIWPSRSIGLAACPPPSALPAWSAFSLGPCKTGDRPRKTDPLVGWTWGFTAVEHAEWEVTSDTCGQHANDRPHHAPSVSCRIGLVFT